MSAFVCVRHVQTCADMWGPLNGRNTPRSFLKFKRTWLIHLTVKKHSVPAADQKLCHNLGLPFFLKHGSAFCLFKERSQLQRFSQLHLKNTFQDIYIFCQCLKTSTFPTQSQISAFFRNPSGKRWLRGTSLLCGKTGRGRPTASPLALLAESPLRPVALS